MKKFVIYMSLVVVILLSSCSSSKTLSTVVRQYNVETMGIGNDGTYLVKVTDYFRTSDETVYLDGLKKDAVHCVIYSGIPAGNGSINQPPLLNNDTRIEGSEQALNDFFEQKQYLQFINSVVNSSKTITKLKDSKEYRISAIISVNKDQLRKYLIDNDIVKPLDYIF
ncbi:MAG: hypothetical protein IKM23_05005 [Bacteroidales bacterium]|nr:hypothetical protein [Bacteroidales bacterium]